MRKSIKKVVSVMLALVLTIGSLTINTTVTKADPIELNVAAALESGQTNQVHVSWTNPAEVVAGEGYTFGYYVNEIGTNNQCKAANGWVWSVANPSEIRTMIDTVSGTNGGVDFNDGGTYSFIVVIYKDGEIYAQGTSDSITMDPYVNENRDANLKLDRYEEGETYLNTVVSWTTVGGAKSYKFYKKDTHTLLAQAGENATWTQWHAPEGDKAGDKYTLEMVAEDKDGNAIEIENGELELNCYYTEPVVPEENDISKIDTSTWVELPIKGSNATDITGNYYINDGNGLGTFYWGIYTPDEDIPYHNQRTSCIINTPVFACTESNVTAVWVNQVRYKNGTASFNNQGDCCEISTDVFESGENVVTLAYQDGTFKSFAIKYVPAEIPEGFYDVADYKGEGATDPYPTKDGKVFAGWYTDETCSTPYTEATGVAYAKFVDEGVFSCAAQLSTDGEKQQLRFVSTVDSLDYNEVGFILNGTYGERTITNKVRKTTTVYNSILADGTPVQKSIFSDESQYFIALAVTGLSATVDSTWNATPYIVTPDGTTVTGIAGNYAVTGGKLTKAEQ